jgi:hypothetical protein
MISNSDTNKNGNSSELPLLRLSIPILSEKKMKGFLLLSEKVIVPRTY